MGHVFDDKHWRVLESEERKKILPVEPFIDLVKKIKCRDVAFDVGAGTGYFTVHLSKLFRKVYAVEISEKMCEILKSKNLKNVGIILSEFPPDIDFEVDFVLFADSLHEIDCKVEYAEWCCRKAKYLAVIDWNKNCKWGPPIEHRINEKLVKEIFSCFELREYNFYKCHFLLFGYNVKKIQNNNKR